MARDVKQKVKATGVSSGRGASESGRVAQRNRTRKAIVDATMRLLAAGTTPSIGEIIREAEVSRRTIYMYFPTLEQLLLDATLGALSQQAVDPIVADAGSEDVVTRVDKLTRTANGLAGETMHLGRALIRLTVDAGEPRAGGPRRGYRRVAWIEQALAPVRGQVSTKEYDRLVSSLTVLMGWEPLIVLKDLRGLGQQQAEDVLAFAARAVVEAVIRGQN